MTGEGGSKRTKNYVYLIVDKNNQSIFVKEIIKNNRKNIYFCEF